MEYAVAIAEELSFTRAAARYHIAQSGLSHQIGRLERELGTRLFDRTSRRVEVTAAGQVFVACARSVLQTVQETSAEIAALDGRVQGRLRVGSPVITAGGFDMLGLLGEFQERCPAVELCMSDVGGATAVSELLSGELEVAVLGLHRHQLPAGLSHHLLRAEPLVIVVGRAHRLRGAAVADLGRLADERFLDCGPDTALRVQVDAAFGRAGARRRTACTLQSPADLTALALAGIGVTVVPRPVAEAVASADDAGCVLRIDDPQALQPLALGHRDPAPASPAAQAFVRLALTRLVPGLSAA